MARFNLFSRGVEESARRRPTVGPPNTANQERTGYVTGVPLGGATAINPASTASGAVDRASFLMQMLQSYLSCPWSAACVDVIARTCTAGGVQAVPNTLDLDSVDIPPSPPEVVEVNELLAYVNPEDDIRQLMRTTITDLLVFGDSFTEVVWLMGKPVALYTLDPKTITILSDEHGTVNGYYQEMETGRTVTFAPHEIVHVKFDSPGGGLYGVSPTQKNILPITSWLFTAALVKETMKRGDPMRAHVDWPIALPESELKRFQEQYQIRNLGARNIGNLFETKGGAHVQELGKNQLSEWLLILQQRRDEILSGYGVPPSKVGVIESGNLGGGTGTALDLYTPIATPAGWTTMGALEIGDSIFDETGKLTKVRRIFEVPNAESWRVSFSDGTHIDACSDHRWTTWTARDRKAWGRNEDRTVGLPENWPTWRSDKRIDGCGPLVRTTAELAVTVKVGTRDNHSIPLTGALELPDVELPISPYTFGAWLGDGTAVRGEITSGAEDLDATRAELAADGTSIYSTYEHHGCTRLSLGEKSGDFNSSLRELNVFGNKHVPTDYLRGSYAQRLALLQGMMDTDGGWTGGCQVVFGNSNEQLADAAVELARSLGQKPVKAKRASYCNGVDCGPTYRVTWTPTVQPFRIARKADKFSPSTSGMQVWSRTITSVERIANRDMRCIEVDSPNHLFLAGEGMIPTHNSQDKGYRVNTCGPIEEIVLEKFTFALLYQAYKITDWHLKFGEVDWRDDKVIEDIRDMRLRNGSWSLDRYRSDIGEPPTTGGNNPILVDRQNLVLWEDMAEMSKAVVMATHAKSDPLKTPGPASQATMGDKSTDSTAAMLKATGLQTEAIHTLDEAWQADLAARRIQLLKEVTHA